MSVPRANILGVGISLITMDRAIQQITSWVEGHERRYVSCCTVHTVMESQKNSDMLAAINGAGLATPDGMPLVWLGRLVYGGQVSRVYGPDLLLSMCEVSVKRGYSHYFFGGAEGVPELLADKLQSRFPGLKVAGTYSPPFRPLTPAEKHEVIERIDAARPDIVWVGLGTPKQDLWMASNRRNLNAPVLIGIGAAFDFHSGRVKQAPKWMRDSGLEWFHRLCTEPRRLWKRYIVVNMLFLFSLLTQLTGIRRYTID